jgi:hypothetical protein
MSKISLQTNLYINEEDQIFVVDVVVIGLTWDDDGFKCH